MSNEDVREEGGYRDGSRILKLGKNIDKQRLDLDEDFKNILVNINKYTLHQEFYVDFLLCINNFHQHSLDVCLYVSS